MKKIYITKAGRKHEYICLDKGSYSVPVIYFRKGKFVNDKEFREILDHLLDALRHYN